MACRPATHFVVSMPMSALRTVVLSAKKSDLRVGLEKIFVGDVFLCNETRCRRKKGPHVGPFVADKSASVNSALTVIFTCVEFEVGTSNLSFCHHTLDRRTCK